MADTDTDQDKTEDPTQKRLEEARKKGQVAQSRELLSWAVLLAGAISMITALPGALKDIAITLRTYVERPHVIPVDGSGLGGVLVATVGDVAGALAIPIGLVTLLILVVGLSQTGFVFSIEVVKPNFEKVSPLKGIKRLFSLRQLIEFLKAVAKLSIVVAILVLVLRPELGALKNVAGLEVMQVLARVHGLAIKMFLAVLVFMTVLALADYLYQKHEHSKQLRMTKTEIKDEYKQTEGDPKVKGRLRQIRVERARQRMMQAVPQADVVLTNPTHVAVALAYDMETMGAPRVIAKGADFLAFKIREVAAAHDIPVIENPPLARALHDSVEIDEEIPVEHYKAVAEVIGYVYRLKGRMPA